MRSERAIVPPPATTARRSCRCWRLLPCTAERFVQLREPLLGGRSDRKLDEYRAAYRQWRSGSHIGASQKDLEKLKPMMLGTYDSQRHRELLPLQLLPPNAGSGNWEAGIRESGSSQASSAAGSTHSLQNLSTTTTTAAAPAQTAHGHPLLHRQESFSADLAAALMNLQVQDEDDEEEEETSQSTAPFASPAYAPPSLSHLPSMPPNSPSKANPPTAQRFPSEPPQSSTPPPPPSACVPPYTLPTIRCQTTSPPWRSRSSASSSSARARAIIVVDLDPRAPRGRNVGVLCHLDQLTECLSTNGAHDASIIVRGRVASLIHDRRN